jgi:hypothetical protein
MTRQAIESAAISDAIISATLAEQIVTPSTSEMPAAS